MWSRLAWATLKSAILGLLGHSMNSERTRSQIEHRRVILEDQKSSRYLHYWQLVAIRALWVKDWATKEKSKLIYRKWLYPASWMTKIRLMNNKHLSTSWITSSYLNIWPTYWSPQISQKVVPSVKELTLGYIQVTIYWDVYGDSEKTFLFCVLSYSGFIIYISWILTIINEEILCGF